MNNFKDAAFGAGHDHIFLGAGHEKNERKTWAVIALCSAMMLVEIVGGSMFGSLALVADGLHMSTHAGAMLIAALAYTYARKHATDLYAEERYTHADGTLTVIREYRADGTFHIMSDRGEIELIDNAQNALSPDPVSVVRLP